MSVFCTDCQLEAEFVDSAEVYGGKSYGMIYICRGCGNYVGAHANSNKPKGTLADARTRLMRRNAHLAFDPIWQGGKKNRVTAYKRLAEWLEIPAQDCHIGLFDLDMCQRVIDVCKEFREKKSCETL